MNDVPAARARSGLYVPGKIDRRAAVVLVVIAAIAAAIASGIALSDDPADATTPAAREPVTSPARTTPAIAGGEAALPPAATTPNRPVRQPTSTATTSASAAPSGVTAVTPQSRVATARTAAQLAVAPPAAVEPPAGAAPQAIPVNPSVFVACEGFEDVCSAIRAETGRALQRDGLTLAAGRAAADVGVTARVTLVSEIPSADFGTQMLTRTYSVELIGDSRNGALAMPSAHRFSFDARLGGARLDENARLIGAKAAEAVRTFVTRSRP